MPAMPYFVARHLARPPFWIVIAITIAIADILAPVQADLCALHVVVLPILWRSLHRRYVPLLTVVLILATIFPELLNTIAAVLLQELGADNQQPASESVAMFGALQPVRLWILLALVTAGLFQANLQQSRRRRLALRRELQQRVRKRTNQLRRANTALRSEMSRRQETEHLLDRSETNFRAVIDRMQLQVLRKDRAGVITYANDTFCHYLGLTPADVIGYTDEDIYPAELAAAYRADDQLVMTTGLSVDHVEQHPGPEGQTGYVQVFKAPEYDQAGNCTGIQVIFWDITQKHRSEIALRNSETRKRALFESAGDAVLLVDQQHRIVEANPSATVLFSQPVAALCGRLLEQVATPLNAIGDTDDDAGEHQSEWSTIPWDSLPRGQRCEVTIRRDDSSVFDSEVSLHPLPIGESQGFAIIMRDVTLRHQAFEALREAKAAAEAASRTKSEFLAGVSHELRTPLGGIMGLSDLLAETPLSSRGAQYVEMIRHSASLLGDVIEDILDFAALEAGRVQITLAETDLHHVVGDAFKSLAARAIDKPIQLIYSIDPKTPQYIVSDAKRLRQVVINLAGNAVKFTPAGEVHLRLSVIDDWLALDVVDTGVGIPLEKQQRVFDAFERGEASTRRRFGGTGLGLSISDGLIRRLGGRIELLSRPDVGSRFRCLVPFQVVKKKGSPLRSVLLPNDAVINVENETLFLAVREMLTRLGIASHRYSPRRDPNSSRPLVWLLDTHSSLRHRVRAESRPQDRVLWLTRLSEPVPAQFLPQDVILVQPVLPDELFAAISGNPVPLPDSARRDLPHNNSQRRNLDSESPPASAPRSVHSTEPAVRLQLLLVDDSEVNRVLLYDLLTASGYEVDIACDGTEAIAKASSKQFSGILMDLQMPDMDGTEATLAIRELYQSRGQSMPPIVALTAHVTEQHRSQCFGAGMDGFLTKPIDRHLLLLTLTELIGATEQELDFNVNVEVPDEMPSTIPTWQQRLRSLAGNDLQTIHAVCEAFLEEVPLLLSKLQQAATNGDSVVASRAAHTLKSCLRHVAEPEDIAVAGRIEDLAKNGQPITSEDLLKIYSVSETWTAKIREYQATESANTQ